MTKLGVLMGSACVGLQLALASTAVVANVSSKPLAHISTGGDRVIGGVPAHGAKAIQLASHLKKRRADWQIVYPNNDNPDYGPQLNRSGGTTTTSVPAAGSAPSDASHGESSHPEGESGASHGGDPSHGGD